MMEKQKDPVEEYLDYLNRMHRVHNIALWRLHQHVLSREVARGYGLTEEQIKQLDWDL